jgi:hypothetical protein
MPAKDLYHDAIKNALISDGWTILHDPYRIEYKDDRLLADLAATRPIAAQRDREKIIVEIKTFSDPSPLNSFHAALGQYIFYRDLIRETAPEFELYLATHDLAYQRLFFRPSIQLGLERNNVKFFIVNPDTPEIVLWTPQRT